MLPDGCMGWDLGGAHIKTVELDGRGAVLSVALVPCPLWQGLDRLEEGVDQVLALSGRAIFRHAITMTGEMVDLFPNRASGVETLISVMRGRFPEAQLLIYAGHDGFLDPRSASEAPSRVASANWMASASLTASTLPEGLLVDVGSTTTDLVPFRDGRVSASGRDDHQRLEREELVYTGVTRTPLTAVARKAAFAGRWVPLMSEHFATTADIYRLTGDLPDGADLLPSADNGPKDLRGSARRLARMLGLDSTVAELSAWRLLARQLAERQLRTLADACDRTLSRGDLSDDAPLVGAGVGRFLVKRLAERLERPYVRFGQFLDVRQGVQVDVADCAPAAAVACLALEQRSTR